MIIEANKNSEMLFEKILIVQKSSYFIESEIIGFTVPPMNENLEDLLIDDNTYFVYQKNDEVIGVCAVKINGIVLEISKLFVHPAYFEKGIATSLISYVISFSKIHSLRGISVQTALQNINAVALYIKMKFKPIEIFEVEDNLKIIKLTITNDLRKACL